MDWKVLAFGSILLIFAFAVVGRLFYPFSDNVDLSLQDINSQLTQLRQGQGVLFQGEVELARGISDINSKIVLNETALQSLNYLNSNCVRSEDGNYFNLRCKK